MSDSKTRWSLNAASGGMCSNESLPFEQQRWHTPNLLTYLFLLVTEQMMVRSGPHRAGGHASLSVALLLRPFAPALNGCTFGSVFNTVRFPHVFARGDPDRFGFSVCSYGIGLYPKLERYGRPSSFLPLELSRFAVATRQLALAD